MTFEEFYKETTGRDFVKSTGNSKINSTPTRVGGEELFDKDELN